MKLTVFTKEGMVRIITSSLMLAVYFSVVLLNYASSETTAGNFFATIVFAASLLGFLVFAQIKNHPPLMWAARGWLAVSVLVCLTAVIFSAFGAELSGFFGEFVGYCVMLFVAPYFGFFYIFESEIAVGFIGIIISFACMLLPLWFERMIERRKLARKYR